MCVSSAASSAVAAVPSAVPALASARSRCDAKPNHNAKPAPYSVALTWQVRLLSRGAARSPGGPHCSPSKAPASPEQGATAAATTPQRLSAAPSPREHGGGERRFVVRSAAGHVPLCILSVQLGGEGGGSGETGGGGGGGGGDHGGGSAVRSVAAAQRAVLVEDVVAASAGWLEAADAPDL